MIVLKTNDAKQDIGDLNYELSKLWNSIESGSTSGLGHHGKMPEVFL
jgi:hypothetical protein